MLVGTFSGNPKKDEKGAVRKIVLRGWGRDPKRKAIKLRKKTPKTRRGGKGKI